MASTGGRTGAGAGAGAGAGVGTAAVPSASKGENPRHSWTRDDVYLFNEGTHYSLWDKLGAHLATEDGVRGTRFAVWAPNAAHVTVIGDFNDWDPDADPLDPLESSGIWQGFIPDVARGACYKYHIESRERGYRVDKADPFAIKHEEPPRTASVVWDLDYEWHDADWLAKRERERINGLDRPMSIYEVHLGSWMRDPAEPERILSFREVAQRLAAYANECGFTHVELLPIMEHPFYGSWGYQTTGYFAPSSRYGTPQDFMWFVDHMHEQGVGVILDWVPSHFPGDEHGLAYFDGTHLFEHEDPRLGFHPDWQSWIFNYGRNEVRSFLTSSALFWLDRYHIDGLRVDAVASMLYRDYSRKAGEWIPNEFGGRENLDAIHFLRQMNSEVYRRFPHATTIAEESTAWPMVSRPTYIGGLGFGAKWDMGWMHDTLRYFQHDPIHRSYHHGEITFRMIYAFTENYVLPLSHDEVVHGKGSILGKMPGDEWRRFANLRALYGYMWAMPGKKLLFMGSEFGQYAEWNHDKSLDWHLLDSDPHSGVHRWIQDLNRAYREELPLHELDSEPAGFEWLEANDSHCSVLSFLRRSRDGSSVLVVCNFTPEVWRNYRIGVPVAGNWREFLNSDAELYGGSGHGNLGGVESVPVPYHGRNHSVVLTLPPLSVVFMKPQE
ncbi:MAG TPA: 1,4-alpha-glucan branching protein GlgB [Longimicrobiales bacterium]|nr:1,4-alpha-glucan branching protein GlgB [Longimicrobiales bacterium]